MKKFGQVVFFKANYKEQTVTETSRSHKNLPNSVAITMYANTPNPASQIIEYDTEEEYQKFNQQLLNNIRDPKWLSELFNAM